MEDNYKVSSSLIAYIDQLEYLDTLSILLIDFSLHHKEEKKDVRNAA